MWVFIFDIIPFMASRAEMHNFRRNPEEEQVGVRIKIEGVGNMDISPKDLRNIESVVLKYRKDFDNSFRKGIVERVFRLDLKKEKVSNSERVFEKKIENMANSYSTEAPIFRRSGFARYVYSYVIGELLSRLPSKSFTGDANFDHSAISTARRLIDQASQVSESIDGRRIDPTWLRDIQQRIWKISEYEDREDLRNLLQDFYSNPPVVPFVE